MKADPQDQDEGADEGADKELQTDSAYGPDV